MGDRVLRIDKQNLTKEKMQLDRNTVVANLVSILLKLRIRGLPEDVQLFVTDGIERADQDLLLRILASLMTNKAKSLYSHYIVPSREISRLEQEYYRQDSMLGDSEGLEEMTFDDTQDVSDELEQVYGKTPAGKSYYYIVVRANRTEEKYEDIPFCLNEREGRDLARNIGEDPEKYLSRFSQVGPFIKEVLETWGEYLVDKSRWENNQNLLKLLKT